MYHEHPGPQLVQCSGIVLHNLVMAGKAALHGRPGMLQSLRAVQVVGHLKSILQKCRA